MPRFASGWVRLTDEGPLVPQSQFSTLLLVVGASSGGVVIAAPDRPGEGEHRVDRVGCQKSVVAVTSRHRLTRDYDAPSSTHPHRRRSGVVWSFLYLALRRVLELILLCFRSAEANEIEILVLRQELAVLWRQHPRPRLQPPTGRCLRR
jgi:hypothetical protein